MIPARPTDPRLLLVEGVDDEHVIRHLYEETVGSLDVRIEQMGGVDQVAEEADAHAKVPGRTALGIVVDANSDVNGRWQSIRNGLLQADIDVPRDLPSDGAVIPPERDGQPTVGVWLRRVFG